MTIFIDIVALMILTPATYYDLRYHRIPKTVYFLTFMAISWASLHFYNNIPLILISLLLAVCCSFSLEFIEQRYGHFIGAVDINIITALFMLFQAQTIIIALAAFAFYLGATKLLSHDSMPFFVGIWLGTAFLLMGI